MPSGGVVDAFKNLIRHGKHHHAAQDAHDDIHPAALHHQQQQQAHGQQQQQQEQQQQQQQLLQQHRQEPQHQRQHQAVVAPEHREAVELIVKEEQEAQSTLPSYKGLEKFKLIAKMGDGAFSNVYRAVDLTSGQDVAVKVVRKFELNASQVSIIAIHVQIMRGTIHPSIIKLTSFAESIEHYFLVLELMNGGELFHQIVRLTYFSENLSRHVILQVAQGIRYLHEERGVVHRDIKPENLLFERIPIIPSTNPIHRPYDEEKEDEGEFIPGVGGGGIGRVKIADFGLSKVVWNEETMTPCGTVGYTAPEIVKDERYSKSVDMWALGCVLYTLLCGFPPFYDESISVLTEKVAKGSYTFLSPWWDDVSHSAKDLITHLLSVEPVQRYTIEEFLAHPWCSAAPAPPPPPTPFIYDNKVPVAEGYDSPLLSAARGRGEGRSPGLANLKEAFDITYALHRMEEEGARRRLYGAGNRGFLSGLNEEDEEDGEMQHHEVAPGTTGFPRSPVTPSTPKTRLHHHGFELDLDGATLLGRRHRRGAGAVGVSSLLAEKQRRQPPAPGRPKRVDQSMGVGSPMVLS
ncbi:Pkinase-domain-containing protein [Fistulina hepatica ATCC 64428]|nr:Pkinase-domain-containing protein [Fistulina hepatica ATCC 64428]